MTHRAVFRRLCHAVTAVVVTIALIGAGVAVAARQDADQPLGVYLTPEELQAMAAQFTDEVLTGGQVAPRISRWVNENVFIFLQLDNPDPAQATAIRYVGIGVKGVFCAETQPDRSFTHFHKYDAPEYAAGHGSQPGDQGYWLTWVATDTYETRDGRQVTPGVDRQFSPTPPPDCGSAASPAASPRSDAPVNVTGHEYHFAPAELRARAGAAISVTFTNAGAIPHTLTVPAA